MERVMSGYVYKAGSYISEIGNIASQMISGGSIKVINNHMQVVIPAVHGQVTALLCFYNCSIWVTVLHSRRIPSGRRRETAYRLKALNSYLDGTMAYGFSESKGYILFTAGYAQRKRNPLDDPGLDGFCTLIFKTVPARLDDTIGKQLFDLLPCRNRTGEP